MPDSVERAFLKINVAGQDVTNRFRPFLISVVVTDKEDEFDTCLIELDDTHGQLRVPADGEPISVAMGWQKGGLIRTFNGVVSDVESGFARKGGGRRMWIEGKSADLGGKGKEPVESEWGEGEHPGGSGGGAPVALSQVLQDAASAAGFAIRIAPEFATIMRPYWSQNGESFFHFGERLARELGGRFKVTGAVSSFTSALESTNAVGQPLATVQAAWGKNLIAWRIKPIAGRPKAAAAIGSWFDMLTGEWKTVERAVGGASGPYAAIAKVGLRFKSVRGVEADQDAGGPVADSTKRRGTGWAVTNGEPAAAAGGKVTISGARPGVDGSYRITEAEHAWFRGGGYQTRMDVENPQGDVGVDIRPESEWTVPEVET
jgi:hypothetical protein